MSDNNERKELPLWQLLLLAILGALIISLILLRLFNRPIEKPPPRRFLSNQHRIFLDQQNHQPLIISSTLAPRLPSPPHLLTSSPPHFLTSSLPHPHYSKLLLLYLKPQGISRSMNTNPPKNSNPVFLNGVPELLVLQLLARRPMYGYALVRAIEQSTGQVLEFGEGCIYPVLHRLEKDEFLASRRETVSGRSRVVYRLTAAGRKRLAGSTATWRSVVAAVNQILLGEKDGRPAGT